MARATRFQAAYPKEPPMTLWQTIASAFLLLAVYIIIAIRRENRRVEQLRAQSLPAAQDAVKIRPDMRYQIKMSDGQMFDNAGTACSCCACPTTAAHSCGKAACAIFWKQRQPENLFCRCVVRFQAAL